MKKLLILAVAILMIGTVPVFAEDIFEHTDLGAEVSFPNIVLKKGDHSIGAEISITDITKDWDLGSQAFLKYTFRGCFLLCDK